MGNPIKAILKPVKKVLSKVDDKILQPITRPVGNVLSKFDDKVRDVIPGGWKTVGTIAAAAATPYASAWLSKATGMSALASTTAVGAGAGALGTAASGGNLNQTIKGAVLGGLLAGGAKMGSDYFNKAANANFGPQDFIAEDAVNLAKQGLSSNQISETLIAGGVERGPALNAAANASRGLPAADVSTRLSATFGTRPMFSSEAVKAAETLSKNGQYVTPELEKLPSSVMDKLPNTPAGSNVGLKPTTGGSFGQLTPPPATGVGTSVDGIISTPAGWTGSGINPALPNPQMPGGSFGQLNPVVPPGVVVGTGINGGQLGTTYLDNGLGQVAKDAAGKPILAADTFGKLTAGSGAGVAGTIKDAGLTTPSGGALGTPLSGAATGGTLPTAPSLSDGITGALGKEMPGILNSLLTGGLAVGAGVAAKNAIDLGPVGSGQAQINWSPVASTMPALAQGGLNPGHMLDAVQPYTGQQYDYSKQPYMPDMPALQNYIQQQTPAQPIQPIQQQAVSATTPTATPVAPQGANSNMSVNADDILRELAALQQYSNKE